MHAPNNRVSKHVKQKLIALQGETDESTVTDWRLQCPTIRNERPSRQKISKDQAELNTTINQLDIIDIYRLLQGLPWWRSG